MRARKRAGLGSEFTLGLARYTLTLKKFPNYSVAMEAELVALETKVKQTAALCQQLREENRELRRQVAELTDGNKQLVARIDGARDRLESLLRQIPE